MSLRAARQLGAPLMPHGQLAYDIDPHGTPTGAHEAPRLPIRNSFLWRIFACAGCLGCCTFMVTCVVLAVTVKNLDVRARDVIDGAPLLAHAHVTLDGTTATRLPWLRTPQMHGFARLRESRASDNSESEIEALRHAFPDWYDAEKRLDVERAVVSLALAVAFIEHEGARARSP